MTQDDRREYLIRLDDELLKGGVVLSEWSSFLVRSADLAFIAGADLAALLTAQAAMEAHLRYEYGSDEKAGFFKLIEGSPLRAELRERLHDVRRFRNRWVHVADPGADEHLLEAPDVVEDELESMAVTAMRVLREVIYLEQFV